MNYSKIFLLAFVFCSLMSGTAFGSKEGLDMIQRACIEESLESCKNHFVGEGPNYDLFTVMVRLIHTHKRVMRKFEEKYGKIGVKELEEVVTFEPFIPDFSNYKSIEENESEYSYHGPEGDIVHIKKIGERWVIDLTKSQFKSDGDVGEDDALEVFSLFLGFYLDLEINTDAGVRTETIKRDYLLNAAGMLYERIPETRPEKNECKRLLEVNKTDSERVKERLLNLVKRH